MKKSDLKHNMIVRSSGGRYGVVVMKDATGENVIKFLYDPDILINHGYLHHSSVVSLDEFDDDLVVRAKIGEDRDRVAYWNIVEVFELQSAYNKEEE